MMRQTHPTVLNALLLGVLAIAVLGLVACGGDDSEEDPPVAQILFLHGGGTLGEVEVVADGEVLSKLSPNTGLQAPVKVNLGTVEVSVRNAGAAQPLYTETINFNEQTYLFAVTSDENGTGLWKVDNAPPALTSAESAVEVVSLFDGGALDVYVSGEKVAENVEYFDASDFKTISTVGNVEISAFNAGSEPTGIPVSSVKVDFAPGSANMVILRKGDQPQPLLETFVVK